MFAQFLPSFVSEIQDPTAIALLRKSQRRVVAVTWGQRPMTIATAAANDTPHATPSSAHASVCNMGGWEGVKPLHPFQNLRFAVLVTNFRAYDTDVSVVLEFYL